MVWVELGNHNEDSDAIILLWLVAASTGRLKAKSARWSVGSIGAYLLLNLIFLTFECVSNSNVEEVHPGVYSTDNKGC